MNIVQQEQQRTAQMLIATIHEIQTEAEANGLTDEILQDIINDNSAQS